MFSAFPEIFPRFSYGFPMVFPPGWRFAWRKRRRSAVAPGQVDEIVLVGGSTRIPKVQQLIKDTRFFLMWFLPSGYVKIAIENGHL